MVKLKPNYSIFIYRSEMTPDVVEDICTYLKQGIKVYLLSMDPVFEMIEKHAFLQKAVNHSLLRAYEVRFTVELLRQDCIIIDGHIGNDSHLLDLLSKSSTFNKEQYLVEHYQKAEHLIVKAGAGTGKTTVMLDRIMYVKHAQPSLALNQIVMITFTNEAARQMRTKLLQRLSSYFEVTHDLKYLKWSEEMNEMMIGTIHSFAKNFIQREGSKIGYLPTVTVRGFVHERRRMVEKWLDAFSKEHPEIYEQFKFVPHYEMVQTIVTMISSMKNKSLSLSDIHAIDFGEDVNHVHTLFEYIIRNTETDIQAIKKEEQAVEMSDLISELQQFDGVDLDNQDRDIQFITVDEFQDSDEAQVKFLAWLVRNSHHHLFVVGDVKQSIYRFRGADYTAFEQLKSLVDDQINEISLVKNYRSTSRLLEDFDSLFTEWDEKVASFTYRKDDRLISTMDSDDEMDGVTTLKLTPVDMNYLLTRLYDKDVAILVRSNHNVDQIVQECEKLGFYCEATQSGTFFRSMAVREFYLLLRRLITPMNWRDRYAFHISSYGDNRVSVKTTFEQFSYDKRFLADLLGPFDQLEELEQELELKPVLSVLESFIKKRNPAEQYRKRIYTELVKKHPDSNRAMQQQEALTRMKEYKMNLEHLLFLLKKEFEGANASLYKIEKYLSVKMATDSIESEFRVKEESNHRLKVMTVHKAKGLEFDYVILPYTESPFLKNGKTEVILTKQHDSWKMGYKTYWKNQAIVNDHMTHLRRNENEEMTGEETRLLYVALTRAKKAVYANGLSSLSERKAVNRWCDLLREGGGTACLRLKRFQMQKDIMVSSTAMRATFTLSPLLL
ncbi:MAG: ATP-dependent helicase [Bacillaceae bacterium]|nr:ATP-dependent helicase [Bacillaceae bacterium]